MSSAQSGPIKRLWTALLVGCCFIITVVLTNRAIVFDLQRSSQLSIPSSGVTYSGNLPFNAYWDVTGTMPVTSVPWGTLEPGQTGHATFYIKNEASIPMYCAVSWVDVSWNPATAKQFFDLTWDFGVMPLNVSRARKVTLALRVHPDITGVTDFSFNILLTASDQPI